MTNYFSIYGNTSCISAYNYNGDLKEISGNKITSVENRKGIEIKSSYTALTIHNNFIQTEGLGASSGIKLQNTQNATVVFNSVNVTNTDLNSGRGLEIGTGCSDLTVKNNILANIGGAVSYTHLTLPTKA